MDTQEQDEREFLRHYNIHDYAVPLTSVDLVIFTIRDQQLQVLLVQRGEHPFKGRWSLPGGFIDIKRDRDLEATALRKLHAKTGLNTPYLEQLQGFGNSSRDPRGWSTTFVYFALIAAEGIQLTHGAGTTAVQWFPIQQHAVEPELAFDHSEILSIAVQRLRAKVEYTSLPVHLLPEEFTLSELQRVHEIVLGRAVDKSAFRKRVKDGDYLEEIPGKLRLGSNRPAQLFRRRQDKSTVYFSRVMAGRLDGDQ